MGAPTVPLIPWTKVVSSPDQFVHPNCLPQNITFKKPRDMLGAHRQLLYLHIIEHQDPFDERYISLLSLLALRLKKSLSMKLKSQDTKCKSYLSLYQLTGLTH